jgi:hypothetical protein
MLIGNSSSINSNLDNFMIIMKKNKYTWAYYLLLINIIDFLVLFNMKNKIMY